MYVCKQGAQALEILGCIRQSFLAKLAELLTVFRVWLMFQQILRPPCIVAHRSMDPPTVPLAVEEGEITDSLIGAPPVWDVAWEAEQRVFAGLNLAALEALSGRTAAALAACKRAVAAAEGLLLRSRLLSATSVPSLPWRLKQVPIAGLGQPHTTAPSCNLRRNALQPLRAAASLKLATGQLHYPWRCRAVSGCDDQLQLLTWAELLFLAAGAVAEAAGTQNDGMEATSSRTATAQRGSAGWSGWDAGAAAAAARGSASTASATAAQLPGRVGHGAAGSLAAHRGAFAAFMELLLEYFAWRSRVPDEPLASPPDQQVRSIPTSERAVSIHLSNLLSWPVSGL